MTSERCIREKMIAAIKFGRVLSSCVLYVELTVYRPPEADYTNQDKDNYVPTYIIQCTLWE